MLNLSSINASSGNNNNDSFFLLVQIMDLVDELFVFMFTELNEKCKKELEAVGKQYPFEPLKVNPICSIKKGFCSRYQTYRSKLGIW